MSRATASLRNTTRETVVCEHCVLADGPLTRMRGLLGRSELPAGDGILLKPTNAIHTHFMRFAIDVVFLDGDGRVLDIRAELLPWRGARAKGARAAVELAAGEAAVRGVELGDVLSLD